MEADASFTRRSCLTPCYSLFSRNSHGRQLFNLEEAGNLQSRLNALRRDSLSTSSVEGGKARFCTKRQVQHKTEQAEHERFAPAEFPEYRLGTEGSEKGGLARGMRIYGLPWIGRLASQKNASKAELQKASSQRGRK